jgi:hypothetical protein
MEGIDNRTASSLTLLATVFGGMAPYWRRGAGSRCALWVSQYVVAGIVTEAGRWYPVADWLLLRD